MDKLEKFLIKYPQRTFYILLILALPAFFINLGLLPLFADEPTRANVALEMILSGNYSVPTIGGEYYYNKPPLYNWLLAGVYLITGSFSEFSTRLPAIVPMFLFSITIFYFVKLFLKDNRIAALSGILFLVNGRMLIYDSMLGHIDIFYSWLTFVSFMLIFHFFQDKRWLAMFMSSYLITALTFLAKGLPSIVFQGFTMIAWLGWTRSWKKLFSWQHILSGLLCIGIISAYFVNYYRFNPDLQGYLSTIWDQSSRRTIAENNLAHSLLHILLFPFEHLGHLFPASLLVLFCLNKDFIPGIKSNRFLQFISVVFLANIVVYWLSPQTRPRYLLMLYPLVFIVWSHAYYSYRDLVPRVSRAFNWTLITLAALVTLLLPAVLFIDMEAFIKYVELKFVILMVLATFATYCIYYFNREKVIAFVAFLLVVRLAFSLYVLPYRNAHKTESFYKKAAIEMGRLTRGENFHFYQYHPAEAMIPFHDRLIFYIQRERMSSVKFVEETLIPGYYFTFDRDLKHPEAQLIRTYRELKLYRLNKKKEN